MALQTSGAISLNDLHVEAGGGSGSTATVNDSDIRGLIGKGSGSQASFSEYYGASSSIYSGDVAIPTSANGYYYGCRHPQYGGGFADWTMFISGISNPSSSVFSSISVAGDLNGTEFFVFEYAPGATTITGATQLTITIGSTVYHTGSLSSLNNYMDNDSKRGVVTVQGGSGTYSQFFGLNMKVTLT